MSTTRRWFALFLIGCVYVMDGYDINAMAMAVPRLEGALGLAPAAFGVVFSALLIGMGIGAGVFAPLGDRYGRRPLIVIGVLAVALSTLATATASGVTEFLMWRLVTGAGLGTALANCTAMSAELAPPKLKATLMSVTSAGIPLGLFMAGWFAPAVVDFGGWQGLFVVPGLFAVVLAILLGVVLPAERPVQAPGAPKVPQLELLRAPAAFPFAIFAGALALNAMNLYMLNSWAPTVLPQAGFTLDQAARIAGTAQLVGLALAVALSVLIDRWRPGAAMILTFAGIAGCFVAIGLLPPDPDAWTGLLLVGVGLCSAAGLALMALAPYLFPDRLLSSAVGTGVLIGRVGAIGGPLVGQAMLSAHVAPNTFFAAAAVPALISLAFCLGLPTALRRRAQEQPA